MDINYNLQILYSNDHQRQIMSRWVDQTITTFSVCTRLDQAGSDWERTACLCLRAKENLLLLRSKKKKCLGGNRDKPTYRSPNYYSWKTPLIQKVTNPPQSLVVWSFLSATKHHKDIFGPWGQASYSAQNKALRGPRRKLVFMTCRCLNA